MSKIGQVVIQAQERGIATNDPDFYEKVGR